MKPKDQPITSGYIKNLLLERHPQNEWAIAFEVADGTGANQRRHADAVAMNLWPSRGMAIHGFEIKVYRGDWLREIKNPAKAEAVARYCDFWWVVAAPDIVKIEELPHGWGLLEARGKKLVKVVDATKKESVPMDRAFAAALFRSLGKIDHEQIGEAVKLELERRDESRQAMFQSEIDRRSREYVALKEAIDKFEQTTGINILIQGATYFDADTARAVRFVRDTGVMDAYGSIESIRKTMAEALARIDAVHSAANAGVEFSETNFLTARRRR